MSMDQKRMDQPIAPDARPAAQLSRPNSGISLANVSRYLLRAPRAGISRIVVVGLPEREVVHLLANADAYGLQAEVGRGSCGKLHATLSAPALTASPTEIRPLDRTEHRTVGLAARLPLIARRLARWVRERR
jgi:hypothetical protein